MIRKMMLIAFMVTILLTNGTAYSKGYMAANNLWIKAVINTDDGPIDAVFYKGGEIVTERGDTVVRGYFYADPNDVPWGHEGNPDIYVKIWFDAGGRLDVNFFHVSVPDIEVYSDYPYDGTPDTHGITTIDNRYVRHEYQFDVNAINQCDNIHGEWFEYGTAELNMEMLDEVNKETSPVIRYVSIEQTGCDIKITGSAASGEDSFLRTGNAEGHTLYLSGECLDKNEFIKGVEDTLQAEGFYGADVNVTSNTNNGEGTISGDTIDYKGTCYLRGDITFMGIKMDFSMTMNEETVLGQQSPRTGKRNTHTPHLTDLAADLVSRQLKVRLNSDGF